MPKLLILKGLPASGKSTFALERVRKSGGGWKRVNKDELRAMIDGGVYSKSNEAHVRQVQGAHIMAALSAGKSVIVDDTNLDPSNEKRIRDLVKDVPGLDIQVQFFDVPLEECLARDARREKPVGEQVIRDMHAKYLSSNGKNEKIEFVDGLPTAVIFDLDGTLAIHTSGRSPYDASRCEEDSTDTAVMISLIQHHEAGHKIILCSGREDTYREHTLRWLSKYRVPFELLLMRTGGDRRNDAVVKPELFDQHIRGKYNVLVAYDDRDRVVEAWRALGLKCFQVEPGNF